jgi:hypothetical protein
MDHPTPRDPTTRIDPRTGEWLPATFEGCLVELENIAAVAEANESLLLYRGHADHRWRLDSTFVREFKRRLLQIEPTQGFSKHLRSCGDLTSSLTSLLLMKFGRLVGPSPELMKVSAEHGADPWFELMKRYQQFPKEDSLPFKGTNLLDWSRSRDVALYFANDLRTDAGAIFICDATATGKTLQVVTVAEILSKMRDQMLAGFANGVPLLFSPKKQIAYARAKNQQAVYFAQMELRLDLLEQWRLQERSQPDSTIVVKIVIPDGTTEVCAAYLSGKGVTKDYIFPVDLQYEAHAASPERSELRR